jgi:hypothetical protein
MKMTDNCKSCGSDRMVEVMGKVSDCFGASHKVNDYNGYVPDDLGVGGGDYIELEYCLQCGQIKGEWPLDKAKIEV